MSSSIKYSGRIDPIQILRTSIINGKKIKQKGRNLEFDKDIKLLLKSPTAWLSPITNKQYSIGAIWLYLECKDKSVQYLTRATELQVQMINIADKEEIQKYFTGQIADTKCINQQLKLQLLTKSATGKRDQPTGGFNEGQNDIKRKQDQLPMEVRIIDHVLRYERPTGSKNRSLRCVNQSFKFFLDLLREKSTATQTPKEGTIKSRLARIYQKKKYPIIVVPQVIQAGNVSLSNIQTLLLQGKYEQPKPLTNSIQRKIQIETTLRGKKVIFEITNNPSLLSLSDWQNVAAVFITGQKAQFSSWAIRDPLQIFKKTKGFLLKYSNISSKNEGNDWNVKTFVLQRNARYRDQQLQKKIMEQIQGYLFQKV